MAAFEADPYGCSQELVAKRQQRDPFGVGGYTGDRCAPVGAVWHSTLSQSAGYSLHLGRY